MAAWALYFERDELVTNLKMRRFFRKFSAILLACSIPAGYSSADKMNIPQEILPGKCEVTFDVTPEGRPESQSAHCSSLEFCAHALKAINKVEFAPLMIDGQAQRRTNITFPLVFALNDQAPDDHETVQSDTELLACESTNS